MSRKTKAFRPGTDSLESKVLLSVTTSSTDDTTVFLSTTTTSGMDDTTRVVLLSQQSAPATLKGRYVSGKDTRAADAPLSVRLSGTGKVQDLGRVKLGGSVDFGGFRASDQDISGTVTLTNPKGSVTLQLTGSGGYSQIPNGRFPLAAAVVKGTGAYVNYRKIGSFTVQFGASTVPSGNAPGPVGGSMTIRLDLKPPVR